MKYLIILLLPLIANAGWIKKEDVGKDGVTTYSKKKCQVDCLKIPKNYNYRYAEIKPEETIEMNNVSCVDCDDEFRSLECPSDFIAKRGMASVYCEKVIPEHIGINQELKAQYDAEMQAKEDEKIAEKNERKEIKALIQQVKDSNLPQWHKKILKRLIKDMRE